MKKNIGDKLPNFSLLGVDENGVEKTYTNADFLGKYIILYIYPKDDTPGCTKEALLFNDLLPKIKDNVRIVGLSGDGVQSHQKFQSKYNLNFSLLCDVDRKLLTELDALKAGPLGSKTILRSTFIIDPQGNIAATWYGVNVKGHDKEVEDELKDISK